MTHILTKGRHKATLISAPKAKIPHRLQSATAVCRLAPEARYSTETVVDPISISISRFSSSDSVGSRLFVFGEGCRDDSEKCVLLEF